jgi:hypothetical protein
MTASGPRHSAPRSGLRPLDLVLGLPGFLLTVWIFVAGGSAIVNSEPWVAILACGYFFVWIVWMTYRWFSTRTAASNSGERSTSVE